VIYIPRLIGVIATHMQQMIKNIECFWISIQQDFQNLQKSKKKIFKKLFGDHVHTVKEYYSEDGT
jgi:ferric iron reductase protein FhuF